MSGEAKARLTSDGIAGSSIHKNDFSGKAPSILQADNEGFSNEEEGYHILWQFSDSVNGTWWMPVMKEGHWNPFQMDLGDHTQRESFFQGQIPKGAKLP